MLIAVLPLLMANFQLAKTQDKSQYLLNEVPQTINLNPAVWYSCRSFIALPGISDFGFYYRNNGFAYNQAFTSRTDVSGDSLIFHPDMLASSLGNRNHIRLGSEIALLGIGFSRNDWFFSAFITNRSSFRFTFAKDVIDIRDGNWDLASGVPRPIKLDGTGIHFIDFTELALGASRKVDNRLFMGGRVKLLLGAGHLQTRRSRLQLNTTASPIEISASSSFQLRGSLPVNLTINNDGLVTNVESPVNSLRDIPGYLVAGNYGLALDGGFIYKYTDRMTFSASFNDLGFIWWRKNINVLEQSENITFNGFNLNNYVQTGTETDILQALEDSVLSNFRVTNSDNSYIALIPARLFAGAEYKANRIFSVGSVAEAEILSGRIYPSVTFTGIARPVEGLSLSLNYSLMDRVADNIGFSLVAGKKYVQFYFMTSHIPLRVVRDQNTGLIWPYSARNMNFRAGINIIFGCPGDKRPGYRRSGRNKLCPAYQ